MIYRTATPEDAEGITRVRIETWKTTYKGIVPDKVLDELNLEEETERRKMWLADPALKADVFVAECTDTGIIGFSMVGPLREAVEDIDGEMFAIYVLKGFQGQGVGRKLFQLGFESLKQIENQKMLVWVLRDNPSVLFYKSMGGRFLCSKKINIGVDLDEDAYVWDLKGAL